MKTIGILIARMTSSRLPGKSLRLVNGRPLVSYPLERLCAVQPALDEIWLATTSHPADEALIRWAKSQGIQACAYPGDVNDVVGRVSAVLDTANPDRFLFVLGDSPFVDPRLMTLQLAALDEHPDWEAVYADYTKRQGVHCGIGCFTTGAWRKIDAASVQPAHREHLGSVLNEQPDLVMKGLIEDEPLYYEGDYRLSVDTQADLTFVEAVFSSLQQHPGELVSLEAVLHFLNANPDIARMNAHVRQRTVDDKPLKILMWVQAGQRYGTGHLRRCQTIARVLEEHFSASVRFFIDSDLEGPEVTWTQPGSLNLVPSDLGIESALTQGCYDRVVLDQQSPVSVDAVRLVRKHLPEAGIMVMDNLGPGVTEADAVVLPNAHAELPDDFRLNAGQCYFGKDYIVLGEAFLKPCNSENIPYEKRNRILVTLGGSDPHGLTAKILNALKHVSGPAGLDLVLPSLSTDSEAIYQAAEALGGKYQITLHENIRDLRPLMVESAMAIAGFGVTAYELAKMGTPALIAGHTPSQLDDIIRFCRHETAVCLGAGPRLHAEEAARQVQMLWNDPERRFAMHQNGPGLVDGQGPLRIAGLIHQTGPVKVPAESRL